MAIILKKFGKTEKLSAKTERRNEIIFLVKSHIFTSFAPENSRLKLNYLQRFNLTGWSTTDGKKRFRGKLGRK